MYPILFQNALYINSELLNEYKSIIDQFDNERISILSNFIYEYIQKQ